MPSSFPFSAKNSGVFPSEANFSAASEASAGRVTSVSIYLRLPPLIVFFPISISLLEGYGSVDADTVNLMRSMGANRLQIFVYVKMPGALGHFFSSLKISVSYAVVGAVLAEWLGGNKGLGCYMTRVRKAYSYDKMFAVIILISVISLLLIWLTGFIQKLCMPWERKNRLRSQKK